MNLQVKSEFGKKNGGSVAPFNLFYICRHWTLIETKIEIFGVQVNRYSVSL